MPKELIHFKIAEKTADKLQDSRFARPLSNHREGLLLGAVFHDALFYAVLPGCEPLEQFAHRIHGAQGQDTFHLIRMQARHVSQSGNSELACTMLVGIISHLYADTVMHPLVWHYTGDYYAQDTRSRSLARQRHRAFESLMDMVACTDQLGKKEYSLKRLIQGTPDYIQNGLPVKWIAEDLHTSPNDIAKGLAKSWMVFQTLQRLYPIHGLAKILYSLRRSMPMFFAELTMLFYCPQLLSQGDRLKGSIPFRHPVTNQQYSMSLSDLMDQAASKAADLCLSIEEEIFSGRDIHLRNAGPSMDSGLQETPTGQMRFFAKTPFPDIS